MFSFVGEVPVSKSWLNRAQVLKHFNEDLELPNSESEDVTYLKKALTELSSGQTEFDLGLGGTSFRFFIMAASRYSGCFKVKAHERLLARPQNELKNILQQLGVELGFHADRVEIKSDGWKNFHNITCHADQSSQFASALLLSAWHLPDILQVHIQKPVVSAGYLEMSLELVRKAGLMFQKTESESEIKISVAPRQSVKEKFLQPEADISSAFSLIAAAVVGGRAQITNWPSHSLQPDLKFVEILRQMGIDFEIEENVFQISSAKEWRSVDADLSGAPDLFPVLAVLCSMAQGNSTLYGAAQLHHKESDRIEKTHELLSLLGFQSEILPDGLKIYGAPNKNDQPISVEFDTANDHRMAMAAALYKLRGFAIEILNPRVVDKSYPNFWKDVGILI